MLPRRPDWCLYCGEELPEGCNQVPETDNDEAWAELAKLHAEDCPWIRTRAHQLKPMTQVEYNKRHARYMAEVKAARKRWAKAKAGVEPGSELEQAIEKLEEEELNSIRLAFLKDTKDPGTPY